MFLNTFHTYLQRNIFVLKSTPPRTCVKIIIYPTKISQFIGSYQHSDFSCSMSCCISNQNRDLQINYKTPCIKVWSIGYTQQNINSGRICRDAIISVKSSEQFLSVSSSIKANMQNFQYTEHKTTYKTLRCFGKLPLEDQNKEQNSSAKQWTQVNIEPTWCAWSYTVSSQLLFQPSMWRSIQGGTLESWTLPWFIISGVMLSCCSFLIIIYIPIFANCWDVVNPFRSKPDYNEPQSENVNRQR